jgi:L-glyceraldehyde 3-phosphate reductase
MTYFAAEERYDSMAYRRSGRSGLRLPAVSLGLWHNFGDDLPFENQRPILRRAFDRGVTHFDLANNYGPPPGSAEDQLRRHLREDLKPYRDELIISTKAGYDMWPGPYGEWGSRKYLLSSLDQSSPGWASTTSTSSTATVRTRTPRSRRRWAPSTRRCARARRSTWASPTTTPSRPGEAAHILRELGTPLLIHQPRYNMFDRQRVEGGLLDALEEVGAGAICFSPLDQGRLTDRYLDGVPADSRAAVGRFLTPEALDDGVMGRVRALNKIAEGRGQTLAQLALAWTLRDPRMTSTLIGASSVGQLDANLGALDAPALDDSELAAIDEVLAD